MNPGRDTIIDDLVGLVTTITADWGVDQPTMSTSTRLSRDLGFSSIDLLQLLGSIDLHYRRRLPYERLLMDGSTFRTELSLGDLAAFIAQNFDHPGPAVRSV